VEPWHVATTGVLVLGTKNGDAFLAPENISSKKLSSPFSLGNKYHEET
jgi:hypothetical protein